MRDFKIQTSQRVRVVQTVSERTQSWATQVEGTVLQVSQEPTGSWYAHGKNDRLWLQRLRLKKDDGEIVDLVIDEGSVVTPL